MPEDTRTKDATKGEVRRQKIENDNDHEDEDDNREA
jgi:hypothetical protein